MTAKGLLRLVKGCPELLPDQVVSKIKNDTFCAVVSKLHPDLLSINLAGCKAVSDNGVASIASRCTKLTAIDLEECNRVTDKGLATLAAACPELLPNKVLSKAKGVRFCAAVAKQHPDLMEIDLLECDAVTDKGLEALAKSCPRLLPNKVLSKAKGNLFCIAVANQHPDLREIDLQKCKAVTDKGLAALANGCPKLLPSKVLSKAKGDLFCVAVSKQHPNLVEIDLYGCKATTDKGLAALAKSCKQLLPSKVLSLAKGDNFCAEVAAQHPDLTDINLQDCDAVTDRGLEALAVSCHMLLPSRVLSKAKGDRFCLAVAAHHPDLVDINLQDCEAVTDIGLEALAKSCPHLLPSKVISNAKGDRFCSAVAANHPDLTSIDLQACKQVTDKGLAALAQACPQLLPSEVLSLKKGDAFCAAVATQHPNLQEIDLLKCVHVTDTGLAALAAGCGDLLPSKVLSKAKGDRFCEEAANQHFHLTEVSLAGCDRVTDRGVSALLNSWSKLSKINLQDCVHLTDNVLKVLVQNCSSVTEVNLDGCKKVKYWLHSTRFMNVTYTHARAHVLTTFARITDNGCRSSQADGYIPDHASRQCHFIWKRRRLPCCNGY